MNLKETSQACAQIEGKDAGLMFKSTSRTGQLPGEGWTWCTAKKFAAQQIQGHQCWGERK